MNIRQILLIACVTGLLAAAILAIPQLGFSGAAAAPLPETVAARQAQGIAVLYTSVSALTFIPANEGIPYNKDVRRQILSLAGESRAANIFIAPLALPDQANLTGLTVFGEDFDNQGAVLLRLKRCDHGQARCVNVAETTSTESYAAGQFQTNKVTLMNEVVDNSLYTYLLELELTALLNSGLRSVRLELGQGTTPPPPVGDVQPWSLSGDVRNFVVPNSGWNQVRVCADDLSHLPNPTHYPTLVVDGKPMQLAPNTCVMVWGRVIEIRRELNTGPSSGTYQILR
jgi:hypothetical protein